MQSSWLPIFCNVNLSDWIDFTAYYFDGLNPNGCCKTRYTKNILYYISYYVRMNEIFMNAFEAKRVNKYTVSWRFISISQHYTLRAIKFYKKKKKNIVYETKSVTLK